MHSSFISVMEVGNVWYPGYYCLLIGGKRTPHGLHVSDVIFFQNFYHPNFVWVYLSHYLTKLNDFKPSVRAI